MRKLYIFNNTKTTSTWNNCASISDDGEILGVHVCSSSAFMYEDLYSRGDRKQVCDNYFGGEPYEVEVIEDSERTTHPGLLVAIELNKAKSKMSLWKPVTDTPPNDNKILIFSDGEVYVGSYEKKSKKWFGDYCLHCGYCETLQNVTHWRHLPAEPTCEKVSD